MVKISDFHENGHIFTKIELQIPRPPTIEGFGPIESHPGGIYHGGQNPRNFLLLKLNNWIFQLYRETTVN